MTPERRATVQLSVKRDWAVSPGVSVVYYAEFQSQRSSSQMELEPSINGNIPPDLNSHNHFGYRGAVISEEKMIKIAIPKEHPYASHISKFAIFPSFRAPDDPETGVRAAAQPFLNPLIPNSAPDVTLMSKTIGGPYRHEILETPMKTRKKGIMWTGEHGLLDHAKSLKGEKEVFYPTPPQTVLPNPKLRDWNMSLSERTSNMLRNLERTLWITSYQMHYTGSGPANPLKIDDFKEKMSDYTGMNSHTAPLRERSFPVFVPSDPRKGCRRRQGRSPCSPAAAELPNLSPAPNQDTLSVTINQHRSQESTTKHNEAPDPNQRGQTQSKYSSGSMEAQSVEPSQEVLYKQQAESKSSAYKGRRENRKVQFDESPMQVSVSQSSQQANTAQILDKERPLDLHSCPLSQGEMEVNRDKSLIELPIKDGPSSKEYFKAGKKISSFSQSAEAKDLAGNESHGELLSRAALEQELPRSISNPCILQRPPVLPGIRPVDRVGAVGRGIAAQSLLDLQNSFSKSKAHHSFNSSITRAAVNLRDNVAMGKKHDFYGINCYYLHGFSRYISYAA
ncbi:hypothetical protein L3Q82_002359 [Scortum barcoo]|uniref:Uncharacterized protein n=1 Tax=Scortum barcoo TaxID=214431 RepID=A0ACB8VYF3_9TELE|nr:hypothetical protein L3Q82_002359 [Scortum barcoo]